VVTVHGGVYDLPEGLRRGFHEANVGGLEWGRLFGWLLRSRDVFNDADAILTCNPTEAAEIRERHPDRRVEVQPHGVCVAAYRRDQRERARAAFPAIHGRELLLVAGRLDPVKNQDWVVNQMPELLRRHPNAMLVLAGPITDTTYAEPLRRHVERAGLDERVLFTGGLPPGDPRLIGLFQEARVVILPSVSETFGLVILEAWAAGTPVIASGTSGARALIEHGRNGWLFDLARPEGFHEAVDLSVSGSEAGQAAGRAGHERVEAEFDTVVLSGSIKRLYEQLIEEKHAPRHSA
jgi:starch synthase